MSDPKNEKNIKKNNLPANGPKTEKDKIKKAEDKAIEKQGIEGSVAAELKNRERK
jgi:hypothetical protein